MAEKQLEKEIKELKEKVEELLKLTQKNSQKLQTLEGLLRDVWTEVSDIHSDIEIY